MGRELKRVPLDFQWPLNKPWHGFINHHSAAQIECPHCENGYSPEYTALQKLWYSHLGGGFTPDMRGSTPYLPADPMVRAIIQRKISRDNDARRWYGDGEDAITREAVRMCEIWNSSWSHHLNQDDVDALIKAGRLHDFTHVWTNGKGWVKKRGKIVVTPKMVNDWSLEGMAHDSTNSYIVIGEELKRRKQPVTCAYCKGNGHTWPDKASKRRYDRWKPTEPPKGDGYQIWETVSEGSPVSPVFATPEELADWMISNDTSVTRGSTREQWLKFINGPSCGPFRRRIAQGGRKASRCRWCRGSASRSRERR